MKHIKNVVVGSMLALGAAFFGGCEDSFQQASYNPATVTPKYDSMPGGANQVVVSTASVDFKTTSGSKFTLTPGVEATQNGLTSGAFNTKFNHTSGWEIRGNVTWSGAQGVGSTVGVAFHY